MLITIWNYKIEISKFGSKKTNVKKPILIPCVISLSYKNRIICGYWRKLDRSGIKNGFPCPIVHQSVLRLPKILIGCHVSCDCKVIELFRENVYTLKKYYETSYDNYVEILIIDIYPILADVYGFDRKQLVSVKNIVKQVLDKDMDKELQHTDWTVPLTEKHISYCMNDVRVLPELAQKIYNKVRPLRNIPVTNYMVIYASYVYAKDIFTELYKITRIDFIEDCYDFVKTICSAYQNTHRMDFDFLFTMIKNVYDILEVKNEDYYFDLQYVRDIVCK